MGEPALDYNHDDEAERYVPPTIRALDGGGETTPRKNGHLKPVDNETDPEALQEAESSPSKQSFSGKGEARELDQLGGGFREEDSSAPKNKLIAKFKNTSKKKQYALVASAVSGLGIIGTFIVLLLNLAGIFKLDHFMKNIEAKAFIRYQVDMDNRSTKWVSAYMTLRLMDIDDPNKPSNPDNFLFRSDRVDTNSPLTDWYRTLRASKFEADLFESQGIKFTSHAFQDGNMVKFRPAKITIKDQDIPIPDLNQAELDALANGDINKFTDDMLKYFDVEFFDSNKAGRVALKQDILKNTKSWQFVKRYYLRKSIQNMTGIRDWRFFENTRENAADSRVSIRNKIISKALPESSKSGKLVKCLFGIEPCRSAPDTNDSRNHAEVAGNDRQCGSSPGPGCDTGKDSDGDPETEGNATNDGSLTASAAEGAGELGAEVAEDVAKDATTSITKTIIKNLGGPAAVISMMDTLDKLDGAIGSGALVTGIYMARLAQDMGLYTTFGIAADQAHTGQMTNPQEINDMMQIVDGVGTSEGWNTIIDPRSSSSKVSAAMDPAKSKEEYCSDDHQTAMLQPENKKVAEAEYHYMCPHEKIGAATNGAKLEQTWNNSIGKVLKPLLAPYRNSGPLKDFVGFLNNAADAVISPVMNGAIKALGLEGTIKDAMAYVVGKVAGFLGATPTFSSASPSGVLSNHVLSGAAGSAETVMRFSGGAATTATTMKESQQRVAQYRQAENKTQSNFEKYFALSNPESAVAKGAFAVTSKPLNSSLSQYISSIFRVPSGSVKAADPTGYEAAKWAEVTTYDLPSECMNSNPLNPILKDQTNADDLGLIPASELTWDLLTDSNAFYAKLYDSHPESKDIVKVYDCAALDSMVRGAVAGRHAPNLAGPNAVVNSTAGQSTPSDSSTTINVGSYNILHETAPGVGGFCTGHGLSANLVECARQRSEFAVKVITGVTPTTKPLDVFGVQEIAPSQQTFLMKSLTNYDSFPKTVTDHNGVGVFWNKQKYSMVESGMVPGRNNVGAAKDIPWVGLQTASGQKFYVMSIHYANADCADGNCGSQAASTNPQNTANMLASAQATMNWVRSKESATTPVFVVGDFNDRLEEKLSYCEYTKGGVMQHAADMSASAPLSEGCSKNRYQGIDHIYSTTTAGLTASGFLHYAPQPGAINKASDHQTSVATYTFPGGAEGTDIIPAFCYNVTNLTGGKIQGKQFHKSGTETYAFGNSPAGIKRAVAQGKDSIDIDAQITKDGVPIATHWGAPMDREDFYDPQNKIPKSTQVSDMTFEQVSRLRHRDGVSRIYSLEAIIKILAENKINLALEFKTGALAKKLPEITGTLNTYKVKAFIKADASKPSLNKALKTARDFNYWTRGVEGSQDWKEPTPKC